MNSNLASGLAIALLAVSALGGWYISQLRTENAYLRERVAEFQGRKGAPAAPAAPADRARPAAQSAPAAPRTPRTLSEDQRKTMLESLRAETGTVWFTTTPEDPEAVAYQNAIEAVFKEAGWDVKGDTTATFGLRPGIYFLMADESPPTYVLTALGAFNSAQITVSAGRGYRQFNEDKKKENPNWRGFDMAADQTFIVAVGPQPRDATPAP